LKIIFLSDDELSGFIFSLDQQPISLKKMSGRSVVCC